MRWLLTWLILLTTGCWAEWPWFPVRPPSPPSVMRPLYGSVTSVITQERMAPTSTGFVPISCRLIKPEAIPGVSQSDSNDCGTAALATLLGYYHLKAGDEADPLQAMKRALPPQQWGTDLDAAVHYLNGTGHMGAVAYRGGSVDDLIGRVLAGRPVPVVVTVATTLTEMHWLLVIGDGRSRDGTRYLLCKNPSNQGPLDIVPYSEQSFLAQWENTPLRGTAWSVVVAKTGVLNPDDYQRPWIDVGLLADPAPRPRVAIASWPLRSR